MSVAYEFLNSKETFGFASNEDMLNFIIDHYSELMSVYRVMKEQHIATKEKKENAYRDLQDIRKRESTFDREELTEAQKLQLKESKEALSKLMEENDIHHYNREELETNQLTMLIVNHPFLMEKLEHYDSLTRNKLANIAPAIIEKLLSPISFLTRTSIEYTPTKNVWLLNKFNWIQRMIESVPGDVADMIEGSMEVNLQDHLPKDDNDDEQSYSF